MPKKARTIKTRYPEGRLTGIREFFKLLQTEEGWRPDAITKGTFKTLGIASSKESHNIFTLKFLGILDENGQPTTEFDELKREFQPTLQRLVKKSYATLLSTIPTSRMTQETLVRFFVQAGYVVDTAEYQGSLFVGLYTDAGVLLPNVTEKFKRARFEKAKRKKSPPSNGEKPSSE